MQYQAAIGVVEPMLNTTYAMVFTGTNPVFCHYGSGQVLPSEHSRITAL
jgi:hypothetical protein